MIDDDETCVVLIQKILDLLDLAGADQGRRARLRDGDDHALHDREVDCARKTHCLFKTRFVGATRRRRQSIAHGRARSPSAASDRHHNERAHIVAALLHFRHQGFIGYVARADRRRPSCTGSLRVTRKHSPKFHGTMTLIKVRTSAIRSADSITAPSGLKMVRNHQQFNGAGVSAPIQGAVSSASNICMGWPGMMVEIACL